MSPSTAIESTSLRLTAACWPVFEFLADFARRVKHGAVAQPEQVRYEALAALRDAEELARDDPAVERLWNDRAKPMMVYLMDYKMLNTDWDGRHLWYNNPFETDPQILGRPQALGGENFFRDCDEMQREYELAERRDRRDKDELAELLNLYFVCLRLGFRGQYHDRPQELADYTRRLFARLPAHATTRGKELFPEAYKHNQELKIDYKLGTSLTIVLVVFFVVLGVGLLALRLAWNNAIQEISAKAATWNAPAQVQEGTQSR